MREFQALLHPCPPLLPMTPPPPISVVIPCYNGAKYIASTLRSVLSQEGVELEVIVVDDGSSDGSAELVEREFPQVRVVRQSNAGVAAARNQGIRSARHAWVAFVDADDIWLPGKLQAQWALLQANPQARMAYTAWQVWTCDDPEPSAEWLQALQARATHPADWGGPTGWIYADLLVDCHVWTSTVFAERALLEELSGFDAAMRIGEDYDLWLRASRLTPIVRVPRPYALYRLHPGNVTKRVPSANHKGMVISRALQRWGYQSPDGRQAVRSAVARSLARSWSDFGGANLLAGNFNAARSAALEAVRADPSQLLGWKLLAKSVARWRAPARSLQGQ